MSITPSPPVVRPSGPPSAASRPRGALNRSGVGHSGAPSRPARAVRVLIRLYQLARVGRVSPCRFTPTCSQYAVEAVERHGARRGLALAVRRLGRCRPAGPSGYDPIPE